MRSSGKGAGGMGFLSANASINLDAIALTAARPLQGAAWHGAIIKAFFSVHIQIIYIRCIR